MPNYNDTATKYLDSDAHTILNSIRESILNSKYKIQMIVLPADTFREISRLNWFHNALNENIQNGKIYLFGIPVTVMPSHEQFELVETAELKDALAAALKALKDV